MILVDIITRRIPEKSGSGDEICNGGGMGDNVDVSDRCDERKRAWFYLTFLRMSSGIQAVLMLSWLICMVLCLIANVVRGCDMLTGNAVC